jgi:TRAP-type C4-dicarboxylate transport system substrate-binding protein
MKTLRVLVVLFAVAALFLLGGVNAQAADPELNIVLSVPHPKPATPGAASAKWVEMLEERTKGKVKVKAMYSSTLLSDKNTIEGVLKGVADMGLNNSAFRPERYPMSALLNLPHPYKHTDVPIKIAWDMYNKFKPEEYKGVKVVSIYCAGVGKDACGFFGTFPVNGLADLKGKEIRATGTGVKALDKLGAAPVAMPVVEIYEALQKNIIKGIYTTFEIIPPFKLNEVVDNITPFPAPAAVMFLMVNEKKFNSWPEDVKKTIEDMKMEHSEWAAELFQKRANTGLELTLKSGAKKTEIPDAEREKMLGMIVQPLVDEWLKENTAKGLPAQEWLDEFNRLLAKYNAQY